MSPNSSISDFKSARYLFALGAAAIGGLAALIATSLTGISHGLVDLPYRANFELQLQKIEQSGPVDTVFVGDSSLGAMLNTTVWNELSGQRAIHLALTGSDGYAGSFNMARRAVDRLHPKNLIVVHTLDMMTRDVSYLGYLHTRPPYADMEEVPLYTWVFERFRLYISREFIVGTVRGIARRVLNIPPNYLGTEYIKLPNVVGAPDETGPGKLLQLSSNKIKRDKLRFLNKLAALCRNKQLNCIYAHGPIYDEICRGSAQYINAVRESIKGTGLVFAENTPVCTPINELGNTTDHIRQDLKVVYTTRYFELIAPWLRPSPVLEAQTKKQ